MYGHAEAELAIYANTSARGAFIRRTYGHLAGAVLAFMALEAYLLQWTGAEALIQNMVGGFSWLLVLGAFMAVSWLADILYNTANVMRHYRTDQHVAAALALFASVALLFWYVLQATMSLTSDE